MTRADDSFPVAQEGPLLTALGCAASVPRPAGWLTRGPPPSASAQESPRGPASGRSWACHPSPGDNSLTRAQCPTRCPRLCRAASRCPLTSLPEVPPPQSFSGGPDSSQAAPRVFPPHAHLLPERSLPQRLPPTSLLLAAWGSGALLHGPFFSPQGPRATGGWGPHWRCTWLGLQL